VPVGDAPAPSTVPAPPAVEAMDVGGATKIVLRREKKGRGGKIATVVEGIKLPPSGLERIARELKRALGCGASVEGSTIVVQGDMAARIEPWLLARGARKVVIGN
jgi:translation initiation factor 1